MFLICTKCDKKKTIDSFYSYYKHCKICHAKQNKENRNRIAKMKKEKIYDKKCSKCKNTFTIDCFSKNRSILDGYHYECKHCVKLFKAKIKDHIKIYNKRYTQLNKTKLKNYRILTKEKRLEYTSQPFFKKRTAERSKLRREKEELYRLTQNLRNMINKAFLKKKYKKNSKTFEILGVDYETMLQHLKQTAIKNYGSYNESRKYHIDHIIPCSQAKTEEELIKLQHYTNLQFLYPEDNLKKGKSLNWEID